MAVLIHVARHGSPTIGELASYLVIDRSALAENLKPLMRQDLVAVSVCEQDKRTRRVRLTDAGYAKLGASMDLWRQAHRRFNAAFGAEAAEDMRAALHRIADDKFLELFQSSAR